ncbi:ImmA/IrrE family metallo-endopeptidase [Oceanithermus sp.]
MTAGVAVLRRRLEERVLELAAAFRQRHRPLTPDRLAAGIDFAWREAPLAGRDGLLEPVSRTILVAAGQARTRQRFTLAHEVMHYLIESDGDLLSDLHDAYEGRGLEVALEKLCNLGAAEMLLPQRVVSRALAASGPNPRLIWELAARYGVSEAVAVVSLSRALGPGAHVSVWGGGERLELYFAAGAAVPPRGLVLPPRHPLSEVRLSGLPFRGPLKLPGGGSGEAWAREYRGRVYLVATGVGKDAG